MKKLPEHSSISEAAPHILAVDASMRENRTGHKLPKCAQNSSRQADFSSEYCPCFRTVHPGVKSIAQSRLWPMRPTAEPVKRADRCAQFCPYIPAFPEFGGAGFLFFPGAGERQLAARKPDPGARQAMRLRHFGCAAHLELPVLAFPGVWGEVAGWGGAEHCLHRQDCRSRLEDRQTFTSDRI